MKSEIQTLAQQILLPFNLSFDWCALHHPATLFARLLVARPPTPPETWLPPLGNKPLQILFSFSLNAT
ncbi:MAG: hypothetical protein ACLQDV_06625 [Candidatus Binataceae bacterium]